MTAISVSERLLEMAAFYTPLALTVTFFVIEAVRKKGPGHSKQRQSRGSPSYLTRYFYRNLVQLHGAGQESRYTRLK